MFNIVHVPKLNLNWCLVPKVASTSISKLILPFLDQGSQATGRFPHLQREVWARAGHLSYQHYLEKINSTTTFLISRHPFARVASAFRNKLENRGQSHDGEYFYNIYSRQIIKLTFMIQELITKFLVFQICKRFLESRRSRTNIS